MSRKLRVGLGLGGLAAGLILASCWNTPGTARFGYEFGDDACSNHLDDDYDGLIDCEDSDCIFTSFSCGEDVPTGLPGQESENTFALCTDSIDNDNNGQFDCGDKKCQAIAELCCVKEFTNELCSDGLDNDQNGYGDCEDFACRNGLFVCVCDGCRESDFLTCADGSDNDADGLTDCDDPGCSGEEHCKWLRPACSPPPQGLAACPQGCEADPSSPDCQCLDYVDATGTQWICESPCCYGGEDTEAFCQDGVDNDNDGVVDCYDDGCEDYCEESTLAECSDGLDNDNDGYADCADWSCSQAGSATPEAMDHCLAVAESTLAKCSDGIDNDGNGYTDCADYSCSKSDDEEVKAYCEEALETTFEKCSDGLDNDGNGYPDCQDYSCSRSDDPAVKAHCEEVLEATFEKCSDGIDNDDNGYADCADFSCKNASDDAVRAACQESLYTDADCDGDASACEKAWIKVNARCCDGLDNDNDGFVDCDDWDCSWNPLATVCDPANWDPKAPWCDPDPNNPPSEYCCGGSQFKRVCE